MERNDYSSEEHDSPQADDRDCSNWSESFKNLSPNRKLNFQPEAKQESNMVKNED